MLGKNSKSHYESKGPVFGQTKPWKRTKDTEKSQTICENTNY